MIKIGKVPPEVLQQSVFALLPALRPEVLVRPKIGEDCSIIDFGDYVCVLTTDPITGAANDIGRLAVHVSCNDIASSGAEPIGLLITILAPPGTTGDEIKLIMEQISTTAATLNVEVLGGHTEITTAVERIVVATTAIGRAPKARFVTTSGARQGDAIILTKTAGLEGTAILAIDYAEELRGKIDQTLLEQAQNLINQISVVPDGRIAAAHGATAMHDVTEGGLLGALQELAEASGVGVMVQHELIPIAPSTAAICSYFGADPLGLVSSGAMLISAPDGEKVLNGLHAAGISAAIIGKVTKQDMLLCENGVTREIIPPERDELYRIIEGD